MHRKIHENIEKTLDFARFLNKIKGFSLVEARGVEPLSESTSKETSPGAAGCFWESVSLFPSIQASRHACISGSFMIHGALKALRTHVRLSSTPHIRAEAFPEGTGHGLSRGQSNVVVVL